MDLPNEIWLIVFSYTDTEGLWIILTYINKINPDKCNNLLSLILNDTIRDNLKIKLMCDIVCKPYNFRNANNYMKLRRDWMILSNKDIKQNKNAFVFKSSLLKSNLFKDKKDYKLFKHLTYDRYDEYFEDENKCLDDELNYYDNKIPYKLVEKYLRNLNLYNFKYFNKV